MSELARREDTNQPAVRLAWAAARQYNRLQAAALMQRAQIDAQEQNAAYKADRRIDNGYTLATHLVQNAGQLSRDITEATGGNPGLEMVLRTVEAEVAVSAKNIIRDYMTRS